MTYLMPMIKQERSPRQQQEVAEKLKAEIQLKVEIAGLEIAEAITISMLKLRHAAAAAGFAIIDARQMIVRCGKHGGDGAE